MTRLRLVYMYCFDGLKVAEKCGTIRETEVYNNWDDGVHYYPPPPDRVENLFSGPSIASIST